MYISGHILYDSKDKILKVFPELQELYESDISRDQMLIELPKALFKIIPDNIRDYSNLFGIFSEEDIKKMKGETPFTPIYEQIKIKKKCGCSSSPKKIIRGGHPLQCLDCVSGHISSAMVICEEILKGYDGIVFVDKPNHIPLFRGHIEQAEAQCARMFPELSSSIRSVKLQMSKLKEFNYKEALSSLNELFWKAEALKESEETLKV